MILTKEQERAVNTIDSNLQIVACAGSGKTEVITRRIANILNKKNGGHGSAINAGLENAQGKYFRVLDSDDYFDTDSFNRFMQNLKQETSDLVLTTYIEYYANSGMTKYFNQYSHMMAGKQYDLDSLVFYSKGPMLPCTTIKTTALKKLNKKIDEHCFYVDQEYNLFSYLSCKTVTYYDVPVYRYRLEQEGQSMTQASLKKNSLHHETVTIRLLKEYSVIKNKLSETKKNIIENKIIIPMCQMQYHIIIVYNNNRKQFLSFDSKLKKFPVFYNNSLIAGKTVKLSRVTNGRFMKIFLFVRKIIKHEG